MMDKKIRAKAFAKRIEVCDTIIVAAGDENYKRLFLEESKWYPIKLAIKRIPQIKYVAIYRTTPVSKITELCAVSKIVPFRTHEQRHFKYMDLSITGGARYVLEIDKTIHHSLCIPMGDDRNIVPQGPVFGISEEILRASTLKDVFSVEKFL